MKSLAQIIGYRGLRQPAPALWVLRYWRVPIFGIHGARLRFLVPPQSHYQVCIKTGGAYL